MVVMKVLILSLADKRHMPMIAPYIDYLKERNIDYDIIRSNRYIYRNEDYIRKSKHGTVYEINMLFPASLNKLKKVGPFLSFRKKACKIMKKNKYDFIIVWNENTAALFSTYLAVNFKNRYCVNIRDIYSHQIGIKQLVDLAIKCSSFATIPSPEAETNFPEKTICVFNKDLSLLNMMERRNTIRQENNSPIRITHLGFYHKVVQGSKDIVDTLGNDVRYQLIFAGQGFDIEFKKYIDEHHYRNVELYGAFPYEETAKYLKETDIINSYYNRFEHPSLRVSFGIKHSYTPMLYIPGLADTDTCWGRLSKQYNLAYLINSHNLNTLGDDLYKWYMGLDFGEFQKNCDSFNQLIDNSITNLYSKMDLFLEG